MEAPEEKPPASANNDVPQYWDLLSEQDKAQYNRLKLDFSAGSVKRVRNNRLETFDGILDIIRSFAERGNENDWRRFLVCGVCWLDNAIAINTRQLRLLVSKCKSSINGSLQKMGYTTNMSHSESWKILFPHIPLLKDHFSELRQWTIRYKTGTQNSGDSTSQQPQNLNQAQIHHSPPSSNKNQMTPALLQTYSKRNRSAPMQVNQYVAQTYQPENAAPLQLNHDQTRIPSVPLKFRDRVKTIPNANGS